MRRFDVALVEFWAEALQHAGLFLSQRDRAFCGCVLQPQRPFVFGQ